MTVPRTKLVAVCGHRRRCELLELRTAAPRHRPVARHRLALHSCQRARSVHTTRRAVAPSADARLRAATLARRPRDTLLARLHDMSLLARLRDAAAKLPYALPVPWSAEAPANRNRPRGGGVGDLRGGHASAPPRRRRGAARRLPRRQARSRQRSRARALRVDDAAASPAHADARAAAARLLHRADYYKLRSGATGGGGFDAVGTDAEAPPLTLDAVQSYDEMALLGAFVGVATPTHFCNRGGRRNLGEPATPGTFERTGVYYVESARGSSART